MLTSTIKIGNRSQKGIKTWYNEICNDLHSNLRQIIICAATLSITTKSSRLCSFFMSSLALSCLQFITKLNKAIIDNITSYNHIGRKIRNQFQCIRPSTLRHSNIKNNSSINQVNSALCITILIKLSVASEKRKKSSTAVECSFTLTFSNSHFIFLLEDVMKFLEVFDVLRLSASSSIVRMWTRRRNLVL